MPTVGFNIHRKAAIVAVVALVTPWIAGLASAIPLDHGHIAEHSTLGLQAALHGHWHPESTPDHDHDVSSVPQPQALARSQAASWQAGLVSQSVSPLVSSNLSCDQGPTLGGEPKEPLGIPRRAGPPRIHLFCSLLL